MNILDAYESLGWVRQYEEPLAHVKPYLAMRSKRGSANWQSLGSPPIPKSI